jgi:hypothetical protein
MGNESSNVYDNQIKELMMEQAGQFAKEYSTAFRDKIVQECMSIDNDEIPVRALMQADVPVASLKSGWLTKMGSHIRSWKERRFEVCYYWFDLISLRCCNCDSKVTRLLRLCCFSLLCANIARCVRFEFALRLKCAYVASVLRMICACVVRALRLLCD